MTDRDALVSIVVTTRNSDRTLEACLTSIRAQLYRPIELIVIDNSSPDKTVAIAERFADVIEQYGPERSAQRNRGGRLARGEYLLFIDSDMALSVEVVRECVGALALDGAPAVVIPELSVGDGFLARCRAFERSFYAGDDDIEAARFFTRASFELAGGFDESLTGPEDWDLSIRVAKGRHLPRVPSYITHDEGRLRLREVLQKKRVYSRSFLRYWRKHRRSGIRQANLIFRPSFLRDWRRLIRHPVLTLGVLSLKGLEAAAGLWGIIEGPSRSGH
jgi:glycosyltransferase involved in cell wall biosynthesis